MELAKYQAIISKPRPPFPPVQIRNKMSRGASLRNGFVLDRALHKGLSHGLQERGKDR